MRGNPLYSFIFGALLLLIFTQSSFAQFQNVYVTNGLTGSLSVIDTRTNTITTQIPVGDSLDGIAINSDCTIAYVVDPNSSSVSSIDLLTNSVIDTLTFQNPENPDHIVITPDGTILYVDGVNKVIVINALTLTVITEIPFANSPQTLAITPDGSKVYTAFSIPSYSVINTATNSVITTVNIPPPFVDVNAFTVSPDGQRAYLTDFMANVSGISGIIVSTATDQIIENMPFVGLTPAILKFVPDGSRGYVALNNIDLLAEYNPATNTFPGTFTIGQGGVDIAYTQDGLFAYITRFLPNDIVVFNTLTNQVVDNIASPDDRPLRIAACVLPEAQVPTISEWGILAMAGLFALAAVVFLRRRVTI